MGTTTFAAAGAEDWGAAIEVPGTAALNTHGDATVLSVSCVSAGNCAAAGSYHDHSGFLRSQAFVASERNGVWRKAIEVPGTGALNTGDYATVFSVSCAKAGSCAAGGFYFHGSATQRAFVVSERDGVWRKAIEVPGMARLNVGAYAAVLSVSCASAGNCTAGGWYDRKPYERAQAFVVDETNGVWGKAIEVPGTRALNGGGNAAVTSVSCRAAGSCAAGGFYNDYDGTQPFVVDETNGVWGKAIQVPGAADLNTSDDSTVGGVSCGSAGNCAAGGYYRNGSGTHAFVVDETNGVWGAATEVPGTAALNAGGGAWVSSVSCPSAGNCAAGGNYKDGSGEFQAFVVDETNGVWGTAVEIPGTAALNAGGYASVSSVSCGSAGNCAAGGSYRDSAGKRHAFVASEVNGVWGTAVGLPHLAALAAGRHSAVNSISCVGSGRCTAGGTYTDRHHAHQAFVTAR